MGASDAIGVLMTLLILVIIYFLPFIIANSKNKKNTGAIFVLNLVLGWTFIGWFVALIWSLTHGDETEVEEEIDKDVSESHLSILKKRYAKGEISKKEFQEMKEDLED